MSERAILVVFARIAITLMVLLMVTSVLNWAVVNHHLGQTWGRLGLYAPLLLGVILAVLKKPTLGMTWLLAGFTLVILLSFVHSVGDGARGFVIASCYFMVLGQLVAGYRLQRYAAGLSLIIVILMAAGLVYEQLWANFPVGVLSKSPLRSALFYMNPNLAALSLCLLAFSAVTVLPRWGQCVLWAGVLFAVLATGSRSAVLALLVALLVWLFFERKKHFLAVKKHSLLAGLLLVSFVVVTWAGYQHSSNFQSAVNRSVNIVEIAQDDFSEYLVRRRSVDDNPYFDEDGRGVQTRFVRTRLLIRAWDVYGMAPVLGHGVDRAYATVPHNLYVFWPVAIGVFGWLVMPLLLVWLWFSSGRYYIADDWGVVPAQGVNIPRKLLAVFLAVIALFLHDLFINPSLMAALALAVFSSQQELTDSGRDCEA